VNKVIGSVFGVAYVALLWRLTIEKIKIVILVSLCFCQKNKELNERVKKDSVQVRTERVERDLVQVPTTYDFISWFQAGQCLFCLMSQKLCWGYFAIS